MHRPSQLKFPSFIPKQDDNNEVDFQLILVFKAHHHHFEEKRTLCRPTPTSNPFLFQSKF